MVCNGKYNIPVSKITDDVNQMLSISTAKENYCPMKEHEIGRIVKRVFPTVRKAKISVSLDKREPVYEGIRVAESSPKLTWEDVKKYSPKATLANNWIRSKATDEYVEWVHVSFFACNGEKLVRSLMIFNNFSFKFFIGSHEIELDGHSTIIPCQYYLDSLSSYLLNIPICNGFSVEVDKKTTDKSGNVVGLTERWSNKQSTSLRHRAVNCAFILSVHEKMCHNCSTIKHNSYYKTLKESSARKENHVSAPQKRETYMSDEELKEKLQQEKRRRINSERRERHKQDIIDNMHTFAEEDSNDFKTMFDKSDENELNPDLLVFWEAQKKAITMKDGRRNRWHPK